MAGAMGKESRERLRDRVGQAGSAHESHTDKSSASLRACSRDNNGRACCDDVLPMYDC